jgi:hypothetical protein
VRARVFLRDEEGYRLGCELDAIDAEDVWRTLQASPDLAGRRLMQGDVVYLTDLYLELNGDGGWDVIPPGELTQGLYGLISRP